MKIKIGDKSYDSNGEAVVLILDICDKNNVSNIGTQDVYFSFPMSMTANEMRERIGLKPTKGLRRLSKTCNGCIFNGKNCENYKLCHKDENGHYTEYVISFDALDIENSRHNEILELAAEYPYSIDIVTSVYYDNGFSKEKTKEVLELSMKTGEIYYTTRGLYRNW